jgi:hypothetical protein
VFSALFVSICPGFFVLVIYSICTFLLSGRLLAF